MNGEPKRCCATACAYAGHPVVYFFSDIRQALKFYDDSHGVQQAA